MKTRLSYKLLITAAFCLAMIGCGTIASTAKPSPDELKSIYASANKAYSEKNYKLALFEYLKLSESITTDAVVWFRIGNSYTRLENYNKAVEAYEKAVLLDPRLSKAWHNMGVIQLKQSVNTWRQMLTYISKDDVLYDKALSLSKKLLEIADDKQAP